MQGDRCTVLTSFRSNEDFILTIQAGQSLTLQENIASNTPWVKCRDSQGQTGLVAVSRLDIYKYEEASDPDDGDAGCLGEQRGPYEDAYVPSEQRMFYCKRSYTSSDISVLEGELVVGVDERQFKDQRGRNVVLVERRGVQKQQGTVPVDLLEGVPCLEQQRWFVGKVTRLEAEMFLQYALLNKTFLLRESSKTEGYVISIKEEGKYRHCKINRNAIGQYTVITGAFFNCVVELVYNHLRHSPMGFKLHHEYDKYGPLYNKVLRRLGSVNCGMELPPPDRSQNR